MSSGVYQHIGNLAPIELDAYPLFADVLAAPDAGPILRAFAYRADRFPVENRWSYVRDIGGTRLIVLDSRATRFLEGGRRDMIDDVEWAWIDEQSRAACDHLVIVSSVPYLLPRGLHDVEAWGAATRMGHWGRGFLGTSERIRRMVDLDHWGAFPLSFSRFAGLLRGIASGERGPAPMSVLVLSGDVHYGYVAEADLPGSRVYQIVCSPFRNPLSGSARFAHQVGGSLVGRAIGALLARSARAHRPPFEWRVTDGPWFPNQVGTLLLSATEALLRIDEPVSRDDDRPYLRRVFQRRLAGDSKGRGGS
jgi:hypothetical protein